MIGRKLFINIIWRTALLILTGAGFIYLIFRIQGRESIFTLTVGIILILVQIYFLTRYVLRINNTLISFIESVGLKSASELHFRAEDPLTSGLEASLNVLKTEISNSRLEEQKQKSLLDIVLGSLDTGIICINQDQEIVFSNKAADSISKQLTGAHIRDLELDNPFLAGAFEGSRSGIPRMIDLPQFKATVRCNNFVLDKQHYSLYSIHNIQREIDIQESESWHKLIRVLTHEIMNSMGPILSLSKSLKKSANQPEKIRSGLSAIESTGEGLMHFINEYRKLSNLPRPERRIFPIADLFKNIQSLYSEEFNDNQIQCRMHLENKELQLLADRGQVEQILINLVKNALESLQASSGGIIELRAYCDALRTLIQVEDSGPGIHESISNQVYIPFFSTKKNGTGIGLSLARQIMNYHDGSIHYSSRPGGRTIFTLTF